MFRELQALRLIVRADALAVEFLRARQHPFVAETPDGLVITAKPLHPGTWRAYADHRMAMAGAIVGLRVAGVRVDDIGSTGKTLPEFPRLWADMLGPGV